MLQDFLGHIWKPLGETKNSAATWFASILIVSAWGYFLIQGVRDPLGGINSLWPLFGIANQLLAAIALCLATTVILKMQLGGEFKAQSSTFKVGRPAFALITFIPLLWLLAVTGTASVQKIFDADPKIGFLAAAEQAKQKIDAVKLFPLTDPPLDRIVEYNAEIAKLKEELPKNRAIYFNFLLDAVVTGIFLAMVLLIVAFSLREWILLLARKRLSTLSETEPVWLPDYAIAEAKPLQVFSILALAFALAKELSGESAVERARVVAASPCCEESHCDAAQKKSLEKIYVQETERRFNSGGVNRCC